MLLTKNYSSRLYARLLCSYIPHSILEVCQGALRQVHCEEDQD